MSGPLRAPFPYYGGKSRIAALVWSYLGDVGNYVEPFAGSLSAYDAKIAGWWVWGISQWIGSGWCPTTPPSHKLPYLGSAGQSINRPALPQQLPSIRAGGGMGVHRRRLEQKRPEATGDVAGKGVHRSAQRDGIEAWFVALQNRLRRVRICCGDWQRVLGPSVLRGTGATGVFLDPPYTHVERDPDLYSVDTDVAADVAAWAREAGRDPNLRIILCGYEGEHALPGWRVFRWKTAGGYGSQGSGRGKANAKRECLWISPGCLYPDRQPPLFEV